MALAGGCRDVEGERVSHGDAFFVGFGEYGGKGGEFFLSKW